MGFESESNPDNKIKLLMNFLYEFKLFCFQLKCELLLQKQLGSRNERRLLGLLCAPFIIVSAISNFYFLGGSAVAETYFKFIFIRGNSTDSLFCSVKKFFLLHTWIA